MPIAHLRTTSAVLAACATLVAGAATAQAPDPAGAALTLPEALAATLLHSPDLDAATLAVREREARALQAGLWPNPELRLEAENIGGSGSFSGFESAETTLRLSQLVELGGKRAARIALAERERDAAAVDVDLRRTTALARTAQAFVAVLAAQEQVALAAELRQQGEQAAAAVAAQVAAGAAPAIDALRAGLARDAAELPRIRRAQELVAARAELTALWGGGGPPFAHALGDLAVIAPPPPLAALRARLAATPELAWWGREVAAREAAVAVQEARAVPDLLLGAGPRYFSDTDEAALVVELTLPLPVFDRAQGAIAEARARVAQSDAERRAADAALGAALTRTHAALAGAHAEAVALDERLIPAAEAALASSRDARQRGALPLDELHDAQRVLFDLRGRRIEALSAYHQAAAELERLLGGPLAVAAPPATSTHDEVTP